MFADGLNHRFFPISIHDIVSGYASFMSADGLQSHLRLLFYAWTVKGDGVGCLKDDDVVLRRYAGILSPRKWQRVKPEALMHFVLKDGVWRHPRLAAAYSRFLESQSQQQGLRQPRTPIKPKLRFSILERDGFRCRYCGRGADEATLEVDHLFPVSRGGTDDPENLLTACFDCNAGKRDKVTLVTQPKAVQ